MLHTIKYNKQIFPCSIYSSIRIDYDFLTETFTTHPCCYTVPYDALGTFTKDDILNNNVYDLIQKFYSTNIKYQIKNHCLTGNYKKIADYSNLDNFSCNYNSKKLESIMVGAQYSCNLKCIMCRDKIKIFKELDDLYFLILEQLKNHNLNTIQFTQNGEPFFYKTKMFDYLNSLNINTDFKKLIFISNLTLLNDNDLLNLLNLKNKGFIIKIIASIDGLTEETYKSIRGNNLFSRVMHNANFLADNNILESVNFVVQKNNIHELEEACNYWLFDKHVYFTPIPINQGLARGQDEYVEIINNPIYKYVIEIINKNLIK